MATDPFHRPGRTLKNLFIGALAAVILYNLVVSVMQPYLPLVGKVLAGAIILVVVVAVIAFLKNMLNRMGIFRR